MGTSSSDDSGATPQHPPEATTDAERVDAFRREMHDSCTCPEGEGAFNPGCPMARGGIGHVKQCPSTGLACPCLDGSLSWAYCASAAGLFTETKPVGNLGE